MTVCEAKIFYFLPGNMVNKVERNPFFKSLYPLPQRRILTNLVDPFRNLTSLTKILYCQDYEKDLQFSMPENIGEEYFSLDRGTNELFLSSCPSKSKLCNES